MGGGYKGITLSICSHCVRAITSYPIVRSGYFTGPMSRSVHTYPKSVSWPQLLTAMLDLDNISHNCSPWPKGVSWPWPRDISQMSRSQYTHTQNMCPGHYSSLPSWIWIIFHTYCSWPKGVSWPWHKVISPRSRCIHTKNRWPGHNFSLPSWMWIIFHTIVVYDPRVCHDLDPGTYLKCQGHSTQILKICVGP